MRMKACSAIQLALAGALFCLPLTCAAQNDISQIRKEIEDLYARRNGAYKAKDVAVLKSFEADDFREKKKDGSALSKEEADANLDQVFTALKEVKRLTTTIDKISPGASANEIIVEASSKGELTLNGPDGEPHVIVGAVKDRDTWVKTGGGWKIKENETVEENLTLDGKPMD